MKSSSLLVFALVIGCNLPPNLGPVYFFGENTAVCAGARPVSFVTDLTFEVDVVLLSGNSRDYSLEYLQIQDISLLGTGQYVVQSISQASVPLRLPGSVGILMDQHGSYARIDSGNFRSKQVNQFIHGLSANSFLLGGFASGGLMNNVPVEYATGTFITDPEAVMPFLFGLSKRTGGVSDLFDAAASMMSQFASPQERNLVMIVHGRDSVSAASLSGVVSTALAQSVKVDIIFMGTSDDALALAPLSLGTNGMFVNCPSDGYMITAFNHLNSLYSSQQTVKRIRIQFTPDNPIQSGDETFHQLVIHDSLDDVDFNTVPVYIKVP